MLAAASSGVDWGQVGQQAGPWVLLPVLLGFGRAAISRLWDLVASKDAEITRLNGKIAESVVPTTVEANRVLADVAGLLRDLVAEERRRKAP